MFRPHAPGSVELAVVAALSFCAASAHAQERAGVVVEWDDAASVGLAAAVAGTLSGNGYGVVPDSELRSALAFAGAQGTLTAEIAAQARVQLQLGALLVISVRSGESGNVLVAVRRFGAGEPTHRFGEMAGSEIIAFAVARVTELEREARAAVALPAPAPTATFAPTPPVAPNPGPPVAMPPPHLAGRSSHSAPLAPTELVVEAQGGIPGTLVVGILGLGLGYVLSASVGPFLQLNDVGHFDERFGLGFIPLAGSWINFGYYFDYAGTGDQAGEAVFFMVAGILQTVGVVFLIIGLAQLGRRGRASASYDAEIELALGSAAGGGAMGTITLTHF